MNNDNISENVENKKSHKKIIITIIVLLVAIAACIVAVYLGTNNKKTQEEEAYNKYNDMGYLNVYGKTLEEYAEEHGYSLEEFKYQFALPEDMPGDTYFDAAYAMMPIRVLAAQEMTNYETFKEKMNIPDIIYSESGEAIEVTHKTPWGLVRDNMTLENLYTEEEFLKIKEEYGFGEEITLQSLYREIRPEVEKRALQARLEKEAKEAEEKEKAKETKIDEEIQPEESNEPQDISEKE